MKFLLWFTSLGIVIYWTLVFFKLFPVEEIVPGYVNWFMSFPIADLFIAIMALWSLYNINSNSPNLVVSLSATGSALIFLGLYALLYGVNTKLLFNLTTDELIEIGIKVYCLSVGSYFIISACDLVKIKAK